MIMMETWKFVIILICVFGAGYIVGSPFYQLNNEDDEDDEES